MGEARRDTLGWQRATLLWKCDGLAQEYARHNGHADLPREPIDAAAGQ
jgi:Protein of unknown function (DUF664)